MSRPGGGARDGTLFAISRFLRAGRKGSHTTSGALSQTRDNGPATAKPGASLEVSFVALIGVASLEDTGTCALSGSFVFCVGELQMAEIFVSYKSEDKAKARLIAEALKGEGFDVWWDPALRAGEDYQATIDQNLREALVVVVLWSARSTKSRWVRSEATVGDNFGALAPVKIEPCDLPTAFVLVQTADLSHWSGNSSDAAWREFVGDIESKRNKRRATIQSNPGITIPDTNAIESIFWQSIKDSTDVSDFLSYQRRYPNGHFADIAANRIRALNADATSTPRAHATRKSGLLVSGLLAVGATITAVALVLLHPWSLNAGAPSSPPADATLAQNGDACERSRRDWEAIRDTSDVGVVTALIQETPESCTVLLAQAHARLTELTSRASGDAAARRVEAPSSPQPRLEPRSETLVINATSFTGLEHTALGQCVSAPTVLANASPCAAVDYNSAEIRFEEPVGQRYRLEVRYAALESRPVAIYVNGSLATANALSPITGGWETYNQQWVPAGEISTVAGANVIRLYRRGVFPHISAIRLIPIR